MHCCGATWIVSLQHLPSNERGTFPKGKDEELKVRRANPSASGKESFGESPYQ